MRYQIRLICFIFLSCNIAGLNAESYSTSYPGQFVLLHDHRIYYHCMGEGTYSVLIDTGIGDASASWIPIQEKLSEHLKVCIYDRAGYGMSDPGPGPRTTGLIVEELYAVAKKAKVDGPYILIGHSFGGFTAQLFAKRFPKETAGIVLVDSSHPEQVSRLKELDLYEQENRRIITGRNEKMSHTASDIEKKWHMLNSRRKAVFAQMDELKYFKESAEEVSNAGAMPEIPLVVLTRGIRQLPTIDNGESMEDVWLNLQSDLANSTQSGYQKIIPNSGHDIHVDAPQEVILAVRELIESITEE